MLNKVMIIGNLGSDPEMRYTASGNAVTDFSVAVNRRYKSGDELVEETTWFRVNAWNRLAEVTSEHLTKGSQVYVEGSIKAPRVWTAQDGSARANLEITAQSVQFLTKSNKDRDNGYDAEAPVGRDSGQRSRPAVPQGRQDDEADLPW